MPYTGSAGPGCGASRTVVKAAGGVLSQLGVQSRPKTFAPTVYSYPLDEYDLPRSVAEILGVADLQRLGTGLSFERFTREQDQSTGFHERFYGAFDDIRSLYRRFLDDVVSAIIGEPFCFQRVPTFRVHLPGNVAVGEFHTDGDYNHPVGERNFWIPLTKAWGTNTVWIETSPGRDDCQPIPRLFPGQFLTFDAVQWRHGNVANDTGATRVSFDFRCIPLSQYRPGDGCSVNTKQRLVIGDYFDV